MSSTMWMMVIPETAKVTGQALIANNNPVHGSTAAHASTTTTVWMITV